MSTERIRVEIDGDGESLRRELRQTAASVTRFSRDVDRTRPVMTRSARDTDRAAAAYDRLGGAIGAANRNMTFFRNGIALVKPAALITGVGLAGQTLNALAAGAIAAAGGLKDLAGLAPAGAQAFTAYAQAAGVAKLAGEKLEQQITRQLRPTLRDLRTVARESLGPGVFDGLEEATANLDEVRGIVRLTGETLGDLARDAGRLAGSDAWGRDLVKIGESNARVLDDVGDAALHFADAARHVLVEARPLTEWLSRGVEELAQMAEQEMRAARQTGELAEFFDSAREKAERLTSIAGHLARGLGEVFDAAEPLTDDLLWDLDQAAGRWEAWTKSMEGRNELQAYFTDSKPALYEAGRLIDDLVTGFFEMGDNPGTSELLRQLRVELLPVLFDILDTTTEAFGPALIDALVAVARVFQRLAGESGPLVAFVEAITAAADGVAWLIENIPGLGGAVTGLAAAGGIYSALKIAAALTGLSKAIGLVRKLRGEQALLGAAGAGGAAGGAAAGAAGGSLASRLLPKLAPPVAGYLVFTELLKTAIPDLEEITQKLDQFNAPSGPNTRLKRLTEDLDAAVKAGDASKMRRIAAAIEAISEQTQGTTGPKLRDLSGEIRRLAEHTGYREIQGQVKQSAREFDVMREQTTGDVRAIRGAVSINMQRISADLGRKTAEGKAALASNFRQAADAVQDSMDRQKISTRDGLREIERLMTEAFRLYGFSRAEARNLARGNRYDGGPNEGASSGAISRAGGGWIGRPGEAGPDTVPAMLGRGEAVLNRHQQRVVQAALTGQFGITLGDLFDRVQTPHYLARGGIVGLGRRLQGLGYHVSEHPAFGGVTPGVHSATGYHPIGQALDVNADHWRIGEMAALDRLNAMLRGEGWHTLWRVADHFDHLHVDTASGLGGMVAPTLKRVKWKGPGGVLGSLGQAGLDTAHSAAQQYLERAAMNAVGPHQHSGSGGGGGWSKSRIANLWTSAGGSPGIANLMAAIALAESGGRAGVVNSIGAGGLWQIHPPEPNYLNPLTNARIAVRKLATQGLGAWEAYTNGSYRQFLASGGFVHAAKGLSPRLPLRRRVTNAIGFADLWESQLALAELTKSPQDDIRVLGVLEKIYLDIVRKSKRLPDYGLISQYAPQLASTRERLRELRRPAAASDTDSGALERATRLADLRGTLLEQALAGNRLQSAQFGALSGFMPLLGGRMVGSFAHGGRVPETGMALVHRDETIVPDPKGPYGSQTAAGGGGRDVRLEVIVRTPRGEVLDIVRTELRGHGQRIVSQQTGRSSRLIAAAPGR